MIRGLLEPTDADELSDKKDNEVHQFVTKSSQYAGPDFQLKDEELTSHNHELEEMDKVYESKFVGEFDPAKVKYEQVLIQLYREIEDPFGNQLKGIKFTQDPEQPSLLLKDIEFVTNDAAGG